MKKLFLALALSAAACLAGCSDNEEIGYDIGSKVLIPKNGLQQVALTADAAAVDYEVWIYRSGYNEGGSTAALSVDAEALAAYNKANGTAYVLMPEAPKADLLDVVFHADGTAEDVSPLKNEVLSYPGTALTC